MELVPNSCEAPSAMKEQLKAKLGADGDEFVRLLTKKPDDVFEDASDHMDGGQRGGAPCLTKELAIKYLSAMAAAAVIIGSGLNQACYGSWIPDVGMMTSVLQNMNKSFGTTFLSVFGLMFKDDKDYGRAWFKVDPKANIVGSANLAIFTIGTKLSAYMLNLYKKGRKESTMEDLLPPPIFNMLSIFCEYRHKNPEKDSPESVADVSEKVIAVAKKAQQDDVIQSAEGAADQKITVVGDTVTIRPKTSVTLTVNGGRRRARGRRSRFSRRRGRSRRRYRSKRG